MSFLEDLAATRSRMDEIKHLSGTAYPALGIVVENEDPLELLRVKVTYANGQTSDWCPMMAPCFGVYPEPVPIGSTVALAFITGDPASPIVLGVLVNKLNPPPTEGSGLRITRDLAFQGKSIDIHGQQVATIGAVDSRGDGLVTTGWTIPEGLGEGMGGSGGSGGVGGSGGSGGSGTPGDTVATIARIVTASGPLQVPDIILVNAANRVDLLLPSGDGTGKVIQIACVAGRFRVTQPSGVQSHFNDSSTSLGSGGFIELLDERGGLVLMGTAPGQWLVTTCTGSFEVL